MAIDNQLSSIASQRPDRGYIVNTALSMDDDNYQTNFSFNPTQVVEALRPQYDKMTVIGMSHQYQAYSHTENVKVTFDLFWNRHMMLQELGTERQLSETKNKNNDGSYSLRVTNSDLLDMSMKIQQSLNNIKALCYPPVTNDRTIGTSPPVVILYVPNLLTMRCRLMGIDVTYQLTDLTGNITQCVAKVEFEEAPLSRITMQDQIQVGNHRMWGE